MSNSLKATNATHDKRAAVVTGGASGIGRGIVEGLLTDGVNVVIADVNRANGERVANEMSATFKSDVLFAETDVSKRATVAAAIAMCSKSFGAFNLMVNNAGFNKPMPFMQCTEENWRSIMEVNALGVLIGTQEAAKVMILAGTKGKIINTASIAGRSGFADFAPYSASKAAVISLTQSAARALAKDGITVNAIAPGVVATPLWVQLDKDLFAMGASSAPGEAMNSLASQILLGRISEASDVVGTVRFLWSQASDYMTGQTLVIDGGMLIQ
jgi:meso-butanediol dehydrogenase / (S,S)-butanediol dehydrogenase / diacetyl reductase